MASVVQKLTNKGLIKPPKWLPQNVVYETMMGSVAYGVSGDSSDIDVYGFCIPPKSDIFPHLRGEIAGFGRQHQRFSVYDPHHIKDGDKEYDLAMYSIVKYFGLIMENNPNMIDSLFTPRRCVLFTTEVGEMIRDERRMFLHKGAWHKFKGYAYSQLHKIGKANKSNPKRSADIEAYGYDLKFAYHTVRLLGEVEQIMVEHDLDITRNREQLKDIRRGAWTLEYLREWFAEKEKSLERVYAESTLRYGPDEDRIRGLLMRCLEHHYGSIDDAIKVDKSVADLVNDIQGVLNRYSG